VARKCPKGVAWAAPREEIDSKEAVNMSEFTDVTYEVDNGLAWITINRPERYNSFRARTVDELVKSFKMAWASDEVGVICLTGAGDKAFCTGGDQKQRAETGDYGPSDTGLFEVDALHRVIRDVPKPVIAAVNGFAIGGGHVLHVLCDLTIAADTATFGQNGPRVGSFDAGFGTGYLARVIGEKRAREIWFMLRRLSAKEAEDWGLVNKVVPASELRNEVRSWADNMLGFSPTALKILKQSFNTDTEQFASMGQMAYSSLKMFGSSPEAQEGINAFNEKRTPDFSPYRGN
jgi:naphthoate synthase